MENLINGIFYLGLITLFVLGFCLAGAALQFIWRKLTSKEDFL